MLKIVGSYHVCWSLANWPGWLFVSLECILKGRPSSPNSLVGVNARVKNSWELPYLLEFGQLARMVVWVASIHFRREAKLAWRKEQDPGKIWTWPPKFNKLAKSSWSKNGSRQQPYLFCGVRLRHSPRSRSIRSAYPNWHLAGSCRNRSDVILADCCFWGGKVFSVSVFHWFLRMMKVWTRIFSSMM